MGGMKNRLLFLNLKGNVFMYKWDKNRKIVYWGTGEIGKRCVENYKEIQPLFFLDSYANNIVGYDYNVFSPTQIKDWSKYFVVITVENRTVIVEWLESQGLKENVDYIGFEEFFSLKITSSFGTLQDAKRRIMNGTVNKSKNIIVAPFYYSKRTDVVREFFQKYIKYHGEEKFIILHGIQYIDDYRINDDFKCCKLPYKIPDMKDTENSWWKERILELTQEEILWIEELEKRKKSENSIELIQLRHIYYKSLFAYLEPCSLIWWGGWSRDSYIVQYIAKKQGFHFAFGEHGWFPGTINLDYEGIAGQSVFCMNPNRYNPLVLEESYDKNLFENIRNYVLSTENTGKLDELEWNKILNLDKSVPTFLLIGMADYGMDMNQDSEYWTRMISSCVKGSMDALEKCAKVCKKYGWNLIYKPHPKEHESQVIEDVEMEGVTFVQNIPIEKLIDIVDVAISITSAVDFKVLLHGKPLVQIGKNSLNTAECTYCATTAEDIKEKMIQAVEYGFTTKMKEKYERHMMQLLKTVLWDDMSEREVRYGRSIEENIFYD